jgi:hypothetical protein
VGVWNINGFAISQYTGSLKKDSKAEGVHLFVSKHNICFFTETRQTNEGMANKLANTYEDHKWLHAYPATAEMLGEE